MPGVVWLEESWKLSTADEQSAHARRDRTHEPRADAVASRRRGSARPSASRPRPPLVDDVLAKLVDAKFVTLTGASGSATPVAADFAGDAARTLVVGGPDSSVPVDTTPALAAGMVDGEAALAVGEYFSGSGEISERDVWIDGIANDDQLRNHLSTIDDVDRVEGRVASTLALAELATGATGNYGLGRDRAVPANVVTTPLARVAGPSRRRASAAGRPRAARLPGWRWSWRGSWGSWRPGSSSSPGASSSRRPRSNGSTTAGG